MEPVVTGIYITVALEQLEHILHLQAVQAGVAVATVEPEEMRQVTMVAQEATEEEAAEPLITLEPEALEAQELFIFTTKGNL